MKDEWHRRNAPDDRGRARHPRQRRVVRLPSENPMENPRPRSPLTRIDRAVPQRVAHPSLDHVRPSNGIERDDADLRLGFVMRLVPEWLDSFNRRQQRTDSRSDACVDRR